MPSVNSTLTSAEFGEPRDDWVGRRHRDDAEHAGAYDESADEEKHRGGKHAPLRELRQQHRDEERESEHEER